MTALSTVVLALSLDCPSARGDESSPLVMSSRLELTLPDNCGTPTLFLERVRMRSDRIRFHPNETTLLVRAGLYRQKSGLIEAQLTLIRPGGDDATRTIEAGNCDEALDGLALLTAVTLDPASVTREPSPTAPTATPPTNPSPASPSPPPSATPSPKNLPAHKNGYVGLSLLALGKHGVAPKWLGGAALGLGWARKSPSGWQPAAKLAVDYQFRNNIAASGGVSDFSLTTATLDLCPVRATMRPFDWRACGLMSLGVVRAKGHDTLEPQSHARPWVTLGASTELTLLASRNWVVPLRGTFELPLVRDSYQFAPAAFFHTPSTVFGIAAGLETRIF